MIPTANSKGVYRHYFNFKILVIELQYSGTKQFKLTNKIILQTPKQNQLQLGSNYEQNE